MISKEKLECLKLFEEGMLLYRSRKFKEALEKFENALQTDPTDGPSRVFIERSKYYIENPVPEDWDGVYVMKTK